MIEMFLKDGQLLKILFAIFIATIATYALFFVVNQYESAYAAPTTEEDEDWDDEDWSDEDEDWSDEDDETDGQSIALENYAPTESDDDVTNTVNVTQQPQQESSDTQIVYQAINTDEIVDLVQRVKTVAPDTKVTVNVNVGV